MENSRHPSTSWKATVGGWVTALLLLPVPALAFDFTTVRGTMRQRRCLVPADAFTNGRLRPAGKGKKQPYLL